MRAFLRDNFAVVIGVCLPIVVMFFFVVARHLPRALVDPPQHDLLLLSEDGRYDRRPVRLDVEIAQQRLRVRMYKIDDGGNSALGFSGIAPRLFLWSHDTQSVREIPLTLPDDIDSIENGDELVVEELADRTISAELRAPDGYELRRGDYDRGFFGMLFGGGLPPPTLEKDGATIALSIPNHAPFWNVQFLAWVIE